MRPVALYKDPFMQGGYLVLCDTYRPNGDPTETNKRMCCVDAVDQICDMKPWFGIEQEYTFLGPDNRPYGWIPTSQPRPQGPYYCSVGANCSFAREIVESHYMACLFMDLNIFGTNAEVMPSQWEYQIGPSEGIECADEIWISRYVLHRIGEEYGITVSFDPKPMEGDWNGAGAHFNFSTEEMRKENGIQVMDKLIEKLKDKHLRHIAAYDPKGGEDNKRRLTGKHETANIKEFSSGVANRGVSVRIPRNVAEEKKGYLEDRRPAANMDPYSVMNVVIRTCFLDQ
ncbi:glutamine synthetase 2 cytoplasmic-like [Lycorma delicatula]|uniref:glutamine synthetase 2 cytoplasmic-like n=1 Tax=Lycorma delicatula TaxID=130591 RepID=UPI003F51144F